MKLFKRKAKSPPKPARIVGVIVERQPGGVITCTLTPKHESSCSPDEAVGRFDAEGCVVRFRAPNPYDRGCHITIRNAQDAELLAQLFGEIGIIFRMRAASRPETT